MEITTILTFFGLIAAGFLIGSVKNALSEIINDFLKSPYYHWKEKRDIKKENKESVKSLIADFCSSWETFILSLHSEKELVDTCRSIHSLISKNEDDFKQDNIGASIKDVCIRFINLHPQNDTRPGWSQASESQIDELCAELEKYKGMI